MEAGGVITIGWAEKVMLQVIFHIAYYFRGVDTTWFGPESS
jgi:hypothetical protein